MINYENIIAMKDMIREYARLVEKHKAAEIDAGCCRTATDYQRPPREQHQHVPDVAAELVRPITPR